MLVYLTGRSREDAQKAIAASRWRPQARGAAAARLRRSAGTLAADQGKRAAENGPGPSRAARSLARSSLEMPLQSDLQRAKNWCRHIAAEPRHLARPDLDELTAGDALHTGREPRAFIGRHVAPDRFARPSRTSLLALGRSDACSARPGHQAPTGARRRRRCPAGASSRVRRLSVRGHAFDRIRRPLRAACVRPHRCSASRQRCFRVHRTCETQRG